MLCRISSHWNPQERMMKMPNIRKIDGMPYIGIDHDGDGTIDTVPVLSKDGDVVTLGAKSDVAVTDPTEDAPVIALLKGFLRQSQGNGAGSQPISVVKINKGVAAIVHPNITNTATSDEVDCRGFNSLLVEVNIAGEVKNWTIGVLGCSVSGGNFIPWHEASNGNMAEMSYQTNASMGFAVKGIPDYIKIVATEDEDGATCNVKVQPVNL